ncbi:MAG: (2Fe-2S)-binding protein, partial [Polyangiaceae bacterium]|nr:(2Fe-2S)-binding protein [Polyangiaceae bacterium]
MLRVSINGTIAELEEGSTILDALRRLDVDVPHLCHDDRLAPVGACRLCIVEVEGLAR